MNVGASVCEDSRAVHPEVVASSTKFFRPRRLVSACR
jgi:hypothetical protein